jgi:hypothetical protein
MSSSLKWNWQLVNYFAHMKQTDSHNISQKYKIASLRYKTNFIRGFKNSLFDSTFHEVHQWFPNFL